MNTLWEFISWLFGSRKGVVFLLLCGVIFFAILSFLLERTTRKRYYNHKKSDNDWDFFGDDDR